MLKNQMSLKFLTQNMKDNASFSLGKGFRENFKFESDFGILSQRHGYPYNYIK